VQNLTDFCLAVAGTLSQEGPALAVQTSIVSFVVLAQLNHADPARRVGWENDGVCSCGFAPVEVVSANKTLPSWRRALLHSGLTIIAKFG